jgi:hypothetical protein
VFPWGLGFNPRWMHALLYIIQMKFTNIYIMVNIQCMSCFNGIKTFLLTNFIILFYFDNLKFSQHVNLSCHANLSQYGKKQGWGRGKKMMMWCIIPFCVNLDLIYPTIQYIYIKKCPNQLVLFYQNHTSCILINFVLFH